MNHPLRLIFFGFILLVFGVILPLLMIVQVIPSTFLINFFAYAASVVGLVIGIIGAASYVKLRK